MSADYIKQVRKVLPLLPANDAVLEIACSSGFLLSRVRDELGFATVAGVEPSRKAVELAPEDVRPHIVCDVFRDGQFPENRFDLVCCFQALDHFVTPNDVLENALRVLKPGGHVLFLNHNIRAMMPRVLGRRCPMYDIEHIYLFDTKTVSTLFAKNGFEPVYAKAIRNYYTISYAAKMFPFPSIFKRFLSTTIDKFRLGNITLPFFGGNMVCVARKPVRAAEAGHRRAA
jgi:SAM-dependent methyltransferase